VKRIRFFLDVGMQGAKQEEIVEFDDDATDEEIKEAFTDWMSNFDSGWHEVDDQ
jgi:hypothetical protein